MPKSRSKYTRRAAVLASQWSALPDSVFSKLNLTRKQVGAAQKQLVGHIVMPTDNTYDNDRMLFNPAFNPQPCMIVFCKTDNDVRIALALAEQSRMHFTIRSGGHCTAGFSAGDGVLIDVSQINHVVVSSDKSQITAGTGCDFKHFNNCLKTAGVHVPAGECDDVCVGGFVQGGGLGFTSASFGMNCDNVLSMRVMLWDGSIVMASETTNMDLWWAMRGGTGGNFGVLLDVTYRTVKLDSCYGWSLAWPLRSEAEIAQGVAALSRLQSEYIVGSPYGVKLTLQALMVYQSILKPGEDPTGKPLFPVLMIRGLWTGDRPGLDACMAPLRALPGNVEQFVTEGPYDDVLNALLNSPQEQPVIDDKLGMPCEDKSSRYVASPLADEAWHEMLEYFVSKAPNQLTYAYLEIYGGAITSYPREKSAFIHRDVLFNVVLDVFWYLPKDRTDSEQFMHGWNKMIEQHWNGRVYQNYVNINVPDYLSNYWGEVAPLLYAVKQKYDPQGKFRFAQEIRAPRGFDPGVGPVVQGYEVVLAAWSQPVDYDGGIERPKPIALA